MDLTLISQMAETIRRFSLLPGEPLNRAVFLTDSAIVLAVFGSAILFWQFPSRIARFVAPKGLESDLAIGFSAEQLEVCFLSVLGMSVLINAFPQTVRLLIRIAAIKITSEDPAEQLADLALLVTTNRNGSGTVGGQRHSWLRATDAQSST